MSEPVVFVHNRAGRAGVPLRASFQRWIGAITALRERGRGAEVNILIVDEDEGRDFNARYRGRDYATNVLSFPADLPVGLPEAALPPLLGDLVICAPVVRREAAEQGKSARAHFAHMTVHGVLHLLGHDHEDDAEAEAMEALERRILADLGFADPYA